MPRAIAFRRICLPKFRKFSQRATFAGKLAQLLPSFLGSRVREQEMVEKRKNQPMMYHRGWRNTWSSNRWNIAKSSPIARNSTQIPRILFSTTMRSSCRDPQTRNQPLLTFITIVKEHRGFLEKQPPHCTIYPNFVAETYIFLHSTKKERVEKTNSSLLLDKITFSPSFSPQRLSVFFLHCDIIVVKS